MVDNRGGSLYNVGSTNPSKGDLAIEISALLVIVVAMLAGAAGWLVLVLAVRRAVDSSGTSRKLERLTEEIRMLRRELRVRDAVQRSSEAIGHQVDRHV
ncbi:hypothetical protein OMP38_30210 [Cohnella ginsengisoli]|uniref:Uncharacterized protein n=1 Tax=Cohnella ginsengisoli TaxID=425004 RepID=A0A9X4KLT8_9BACL|nr:hypothetical protein [Cohnella ginsengisoli]MDG0794639.1 hypothetical protein [Cohnella ginsengisoli]